MVFFIPLYLKNRVTTVPELLTRRFGPACGDIYSYVMLFAYVFLFLTPALYGGSITFSQLTGWPPAAVLVGVALLVGSYTILGGLSSVMWTDAFQCVMLVIGGVVLFFVALAHIPGGWSAMVQAARSASIFTIRPAIRKRRSSVSSRRRLACFFSTNPPTR